MRKSKRRTARPARKTISSPISRYQRQIDALKPQIGRVAPRHIAREVIGLFEKIRAESSRQFTLADFARLFDPTVPTYPFDSVLFTDGYLHNSTYQKLDYMRRSLRRTAVS